MSFELKDDVQLAGIWNSNGQDPLSRERVQMTDALSVPNAPLLFPKVISNIVKEAAEPLLVGTSLLTRINYSYGQTITFPAVGAMVAADIGEGMAYPEQNLQMGGATVTATIGKSGLAVKVTDEMIRYSQFDVIGMHLRAAGRALARHKEVKIFNYIRSMGTTVFDNLNPGLSLKGVCTGRDMDGSPNGSVTMDDVFDTFAQVITQGFTPNTILMHPLTWTMFVKDAQLRAFALMSGGGTFFATWSGQPAGGSQWGNSSQGGLGVGSGQNIVPGQTDGGQSGGAASAPHALTASELLDHPQTLNSAPVLPSYLGIPFRIIVSPFVPFDPARKLSDVYMFDASELGVLVVDEDVMTEEWDDPKVDIKKIKLRERYAIGLLHEGHAIAKIMNAHIVPNEIAMPVQANIDVSGNLGPVDPGTALSL
tara:strand:- start:1774 stop:3042 length:1269 start_codon:yes stop_codon:yes gene_type:complete